MLDLMGRGLGFDWEFLIGIEGLCIEDERVKCQGDPLLCQTLNPPLPRKHEYQKGVENEFSFSFLDN
jgi:hypothetical protein